MALTRINNQALTNVTSAGLPSGTVLQVVNSVSTDKFSHSGTSSSWSSNITGLATSITPKSTSSKILIMGAVSFATHNTTYGTLATIRCLRDSTQIGDDYFFARSAGYDSADDSSAQGCATCSYLDSPSTTSQITYNFQIKQVISGSTSITSYINGDQNGTNFGQSSITLIEIAG